MLIPFYHAKHLTPHSKLFLNLEAHPPPVSPSLLIRRAGVRLHKRSRYILEALFPSILKMEFTPMSPLMTIGFFALQGVAIGGGIGCISEIVDAAKLVINQVRPVSFCAHFFFSFFFPVLLFDSCIGDS
jgi:hypothetical protein